jgi:diacylglycerol O-acyltransferase / wax synthase
MRRLTGTDSLFLSLETPASHQHIGGLVILEPSDCPVVFEDVVRSIEARLDWVPKFRWKLMPMPLGLDVPFWVDDDGFDVRRHVNRVAVLSPGGLQEAADVAGRIMSSQLDRDQPLWELWFLEGLAGGRVGIVMKYHHCLLDGVSGASLATILMDVEPHASEPLIPLPPLEDQQAGSVSGSEIVRRLADRAARRPLRLPRYLTTGAMKIFSGAVEHARSDHEGGMLLRAPATSFNKSIGPERALSFASVASADLDQLKIRHDVTFNDLVLALVAGALRSYLLDTGGLPEAPLIAGVPVSTRSVGDGTLDNQLSAMFVSLATDIPEPVARLLAVGTSGQRAKALQRAMSARPIESIGEVISPLTLSTAIDALCRAGLGSRGPTIVNTTVSNVPGPRFPLYMCGAKVAGIFPCSIIFEGMGINCTVISYLDRVDFGFNVDPALVPDPSQVAGGINAALAELKLASGLGPVTEVANAFGASTARTS